VLEGLFQTIAGNQGRDDDDDNAQNGQSTECPLFQPRQTCEHWVLHHNDETMELDASSDGFAMMQIDKQNMAV
jgi:hypothetical protein